MILSGCLIFNKGKILLLRRKDHGHLETPGGKVKEGETLKEAALRELKEEIGKVKVSNIEYLGSVNFLIPTGEEGTAHKFVMKYISGEIELEDKFSGYEWVDDFEREDLSPDLKLFKEELVELSKKYK